MTYDSRWIAAIRVHLIALAEITQTLLPSSTIVNTYLRMIHDEAHGARSELVIGEACKRVAASWRYPSYPKPADIIYAIRAVRADSGFLASIAEKEESRMLGDGERDTLASYTEEERARAQVVIREWKARHGMLKEDAN